LVEKLANFKQQKLQIIRVGHPARLLPSVLNKSLDVMLFNDDSAKILTDIRNDMDNVFKTLAKTRQKQERYKLKGKRKLKINKK